MTATSVSPAESPNRAPNAQDALLHAGTARLTQGLSPGSIVGAYMDWLAHLGERAGQAAGALTDIRAPLFVVGTQRDHVSPWLSVYQVHLLTDTEVTFLLTSGGHNVGIVNPPGDGFPGRHYQVSTRPDQSRYIDPDTWAASTPKHEGSWWPAFLAWLNARCGAMAVPPGMGAPEAGLLALYDAPGEYVLVS